MKNLSLIILVLLGLNTSAQTMNKKVYDTGNQKDILINHCTRDGITNFADFKSAYDIFYADYKPDTALLPLLKEKLANKHITIVLGTWCDDSKLQVSHFLKIADAISLPDGTLSFIAVNGQKKAENNLIDTLKIERVPTFIVTDAKKHELGRIVEVPRVSLEKDLLEILSK